MRVRYLRDALEGILAGRAVTRAVVPMTAGCLIPRPEKTVKRPATGDSAVNYAQHIAPLLNRSCVPCHRDGQVAPFALDSYTQAKLWAPMIAESTRRKLMPPWKAAPGYGEFHGDMSLKEGDITLLQRWNEQGAPSGDLKMAPKPPPMVKGWSAGTPDVEISMERPYRLTPDGKDNYRCFILPTEFREDAYVNLSQVQIGFNRAQGAGIFLPSTVTVNSVVNNLTGSELTDNTRGFLTFPTTFSGTALTISLADSSNSWIFVDEVRFVQAASSAAPEPATLTLLLVGGLTLVRRRSRRS